VHLCLHVATDTRLAARIFDKRVAVQAGAADFVTKERAVLAALASPPASLRSHPGRKHVVRLATTAQDDRFVVMFMELCPRGTLSHVLRYGQAPVLMLRTWVQRRHVS